MNWPIDSLLAELNPLLPGLSLEVLPSCPSTNTELLERARRQLRPPHPKDEDESGDGRGLQVQVRRSRESASFGIAAAQPRPCLLVTEHQTQGRGRMGRTWASAAGDSLTFSLSLPVQRVDLSGLSLAVGVALAEALDTPEAGRPVRIGLKWPNDLWLLDSLAGAPVRGRKLGGILIETCSAAGRRVAVIGIGLNLRPMSVADPTFAAATGSLSELGSDTSPPATFARVAAPLARALQQFQVQGFAAFAERYASRDVLKGQQVVLLQGDSVTQGRADGISDQGALQVLSAAGLQQVSSGEVSVRLGQDSPESTC